ncbi:MULTISPECIES: TlpA family protein disulfide reductase [Olivibacter]|uniref:TlpA family protein disulfide reductase n=1 Tax=Olivibacter jilunii TaxID=985016 RepID=A0ABW6B4V8_9SPHI|nr:TlpA disulfide reductase family protein [Pseudosphingobacterium sp.]
MKAFLRLMGGVCAVGKLLVQAISRKNKILNTARKSSLTMNDERLVMSALVSFAYRSFVLFCNEIRMTCEVKPVSRTRCIQKINEKTTCNSRVTGKWGLRGVQGAFCWFFAAKNCIKKYWKFRCRYLFSSQNGADENMIEAMRRRRLPRRKLLAVKRSGKASRGLKPYTVYLITLKILFCVCLAHARQSSSPEAAHGVASSADSIRPLQIGDTIPEALWHMPLQMVKAGQEGSSTVTLSVYRGKLIILDFWATWCTVCLASFPKIDSLQQQFSNEVKILLVNASESADRVRARLPLKKRTMTVDMVYEKKVLRQSFPFRSIPHHIWIGTDGKVVAITSGNNTDARSIGSYLNEQKIALPTKVDLQDFDPKTPLWLEGNGRHEDQLMGYAYVMRYIPGIPNSFQKEVDSLGRFRSIRTGNRSVADLYSILVGGLEWYNNPFNRANRIILETKKPAELQLPQDKATWDDWKQEHYYVYEMRVPEHYQGDGADLMRQDLERYFPYTGKLEDRSVPCLVLTTAKRHNDSKTKEGKPRILKQGNSLELINQPVDVLIRILQKQLKALNLPIISEQTRSFNLNLTLNMETTNLNQLSKELAIYGLALKKQKRKIPMLVIRDKEVNQ